MKNSPFLYWFNSHGLKFLYTDLFVSQQEVNVWLVCNAGSQSSARQENLGALPP